MKSLLLFTSLILLSGTATVRAQIASMNMSMFQAQGEFNRNIDNDPIGVSFTYLHELNDGPWGIGAEFGIAMYSNNEYEAIDDNGNAMTVYEEDCFYALHLMPQYKLYDHSMVELYGEGRVGMTTFFSEKHAQEETAEFDDSFKFHGTAFNLGIGAGARVNLSGIFTGDGLLHDRVWLDASMTTSSGSRTTYRSAGEDTRSLNDANFRSLTDYTHIRVGIAFRMN